MDMQGTPIGGTNQGMKNTSDPASKQKFTSESTGPVASDSLAASSDAFQSSNSDSNPMSVSGSNSTLNNTDTSAATTLPPASSTSAREADSEDSSAKYPEGTGGVPEFKGSHQPSGYSGGPSDSNTGTDSSSNTNADYSSTTNTASNTANTDNTGSFENADPAPSYIISQAATGGKPKGTNITEGGFESDDKNNASFNTDVDSENDPARLANQKMQRMNASTTGEHSGGPAETGTAEDGSGAYDALGSESQI